MPPKVPASIHWILLSISNFECHKDKEGNSHCIIGNEKPKMGNDVRGETSVFAILPCTNAQDISDGVELG